ncbi:E3 ubiquitin-protein ligase TRIM7-like [Eublepharis macularius]|uniref:RING-type E3 ubiquitin transferase n=1 Tax=Eublepharis macularius TaxID=481883 RepID=A0AA97KUE9_EUBMA|nr:E3 ubiquitin-protein ligase TRIM7-like [Eublepharis macularius]
MDAESPSKKLQEETTCSVCLDFFTEPVTLDCGHHFCRTCIVPCRHALPDVCPQCGELVTERSWKPNRQLERFAEIAKRFSDQEKAEAGAGGVCEEHREPLKLFCEDDGVPICVVCDRSREHRDHAVVPVEEAAQGYKERFCNYLEVLRKEKEKILACAANTEQESQELLKVTKSEREKTLIEFRKLHEFLEEQETLMLAQVEEVEEELARERHELLARLSVELSSLENIIQEMEEKCQQPVSNFLKDVRSSLKRYEEKEKFENPVAFPPELKRRIWDICDLNPFLEGVVKQFQVTLVSGLQQQEANVTLDPDTAHPHLALSEDYKSISRGDKYQDLPDNPERFDKHCMVLGCEKFSTGRHCWEVTVGSEDGWAVGVAKTSVKRKGKFNASPEAGIWALRTWKSTYKALVPSLSSHLPLSRELRRIQVSLNCTGRQVAFFDADTATPLFTFSEISSGETLQPFFWVYDKGCLTISPQGSQPHSQALADVSLQTKVTNLKTKCNEQVSPLTGL